MGMIGGGIGAFIGDAHRRASRICNDFELVCGVFDVNYERSREFAAKEDLDLDRCYESVDAMIEAELRLPAEQRMQSVSIVTPNALHFPFAKKLLQKGFHLVCEKPMTMTVEEAEELESLVASTGLTFALTHTYTGYPMVRQMRDLVAKGVLEPYNVLMRSITRDGSTQSFMVPTAGSQVYGGSIPNMQV